MSKLDVAQVCFIEPMLFGLKKAGVNLAKLKSRSGLDKFNLSESENYIPISTLYSFFDQLSHEEGIVDPQIIFAKEIQLTSLASWG